MLILIVDDSERKREKISAAIAEAVGTRGIDVEFAVSGAEAAEKLEASRFDLMILDLYLPVKQGDAPKKDGGLRFLRQVLKAGPRFRRPAHIMGLTAYEDLAGSSAGEFAAEGWQLVQFDETSEGWSETVQNKVRHISESLRNPHLPHPFDLAILTALKPVELEAVLQLPAEWKEESCPGDSTVYHVGTFRPAGGGTHKVVAAAAIEMGLPAAAGLATKVIARFRPRFVAMAGIAAGIGLNFGDIIIADQSWDYGSGKVRTPPKNQSAFAPAPNYIPLDASIKEKADFFVTRRADVVAGIKRRWPGNAPATDLVARTGPVASGAAVVENEAAISAIKEHNRKVIGVEMEIYGVYLAARIAPEPRPLVFAAKSVCDFGVPPKTDEYQKYAAFTSANFIYEFYLDQLANLR